MKRTFENIAIASDLDGTFFGRNASLLERNIKAVQRFVAEGGTFTVSTGRCIRMMDCIFPEAAAMVNAPAILCNGAYFYDYKTNSLLDEYAMKQNELLKIVSAVEEKFPEAGYRVSTLKGILLPKETEFMRERMQIYSRFVVRERLEDNREHNWHKMVYQCPADLIRELKQYIPTISSGDFFFSSSSDSIYEIVPKECGKGSRIKQLKETIWKSKTVYCVGDQQNDIDMLEVCDVPCCPGNAIDEVKELSKIHLCHNSEGCIADLIDRLEKRN